MNMHMFVAVQLSTKCKDERTAQEIRDALPISIFEKSIREQGYIEEAERKKRKKL